MVGRISSPSREGKTKPIGLVGLGRVSPANYPQAEKAKIPTPRQPTQENPNGYLMRYEPKPHHVRAIRWLLGQFLAGPRNSGGGALLLDPGLGKTAVTLSAIDSLIRAGAASKILIVAPLRVCYSVWPGEVAKWDEFSHLKTQIVRKEKDFQAAADIFLINPESLPKVTKWINAQKSMPFQVLIVDESTKFKTWGAKCTKQLRALAPFIRYRAILTGTPAPNGLEDLFSQIYLVDLGASLGKTITEYREQHFHRGGFNGYEWIPNDTAKAQIEARIASVCLRLSGADYLDLPPIIYNQIRVDLPAKVLADYKRFENEMFLDLGKSAATALNPGSKYLKCKQLATGGIYDDDKKPLFVHNTKTEAVRELLGELQGKPLLVAYHFRHELSRLQKMFPKLEAVNGGVSAAKSADIIDRWNRGQIQILAAQPQAVGHGVNMQSGPGRDIVWTSPPDSLELWIQFNARIYRQGVTGQVRVHTILANRTVDLAGATRLENKEEIQKTLLEALEMYRKFETLTKGN